MFLIWPFEIPLTLLIQNLGAWLAPIMQGLSFLGTEDFFIVAMPVIFWCLDAALGFRLGLLILSSASVNSWLKTLFHRPRPYWVDTRVKALASETSFGFPSGHAQNSTVIWSRIAVYLKRTWVWVVAILLILGTAFSRLYLGVHFISDLVGGLIIGVLFLLAFLALEKPVQKFWQKISFPLQTILAFLSSLILILMEVLVASSLSGFSLPAEWVSNSTRAFPDVILIPVDISGAFTLAGTWFGMIVGYSWISIRGGFRVAPKWHHKLFSLILGLIGVFAIRMGLNLIFPPTADWVGYFFRYLRYFLVGLWVTGLAPMIFVALKWAKKNNQSLVK